MGRLFWTANDFSLMKFFISEYQSLAEQEWIVFQKKLHLIDELVSGWMAKLEPYTTVTLFLQQELDKYVVSKIFRFVPHLYDVCLGFKLAWR